MSGDFKDEASKNSVKLLCQLLQLLNRGTLERRAWRIWFNQEEIAKLKKNPKAFNFKAVKI